MQRFDYATLVLYGHETPVAVFRAFARTPFEVDVIRELTKRGNLDDVLAGLFAAKKVGMAPIKVNAVIIRGTNDDEILDLVEFARTNGFEMRLVV